MRKKLAIVRGRFLNKFEMQSFEPLAKAYDMRAFSSLYPLHDSFAFPTTKLISPMDTVEFPFKISLLNRLFVDAHYLFGLRESLRGFDIAHTAETYYHYTQQCLDAKKKGYVKKVIATVWENIPFNNEGIFGREIFKKRTIAELDHIIAVSERAKLALLLEGADDHKITVINPGIDISKFTVNGKKTKKQITILFVGRLEEEKGIVELLLAFKKLLTDKDLKGYRLRLVYVGTGSQKKNLLALIKKLYIEKYIVVKSIPYELISNEYRKSDIFVAPSKGTFYWQEQWGMALMEAQASGLPIITTRSGSIEENVGDAAILVQPGDVLSVYQAIKKLILNPQLRLQFSEKARKRAVEVHDARIAAKKIAEVYEKVLSE